jgi:hypothetical protein
MKNNPGGRMRPLLWDAKYNFHVEFYLAAFLFVALRRVLKYLEMLTQYRRILLLQRTELLEISVQRLLQDFWVAKLKKKSEAVMHT